MANCTKWQSLSPREKIVFTGGLLHSAMSDNSIFEQASKLINKARRMGVLEGVEILPDALKTEGISEN